MRNIITTFFGALLLLTLGGCSTHDYTMQDPGFMPRVEMAEVYKLNKEWWKAYGDPQLDALVAQALASNIDLAKSAISVNKALYQANQLGADLVPSFSGSGSAGSTSNTATGDASRSYSGSLSISYELDLWARLRNARSAQVWEYEATQEDLESARLALINNVVKSYYNLMYLYQAQDVTRQGIDFYENLARIVDEKYRVGKVDGLEPITTKQSLLSEQNSLIDLENQQKSAEQTLRNLLNLRPGDDLGLKPLDLLQVSTPPVDLDVPLAALGQRPDVQAAEYRLQKAFDSLGAEKASLYPSITLGSSLGVSAASASNLFDAASLGGTIKINFPFLQYNKLRWNIKSSEASLEDAELNFIQKVTTALNEVDAYYFAYNKSLSQLEIIAAKYEADSEITRYRETRYEVGVDELSDWLQARRTENNSRLSTLKAKYSVIENENAIYQAMGGRVTTK